MVKTLSKLRGELSQLDEDYKEIANVMMRNSFYINITYKARMCLLTTLFQHCAGNSS